MIFWNDLSPVVILFVFLLGFLVFLFLVVKQRLGENEKKALLPKSKQRNTNHNKLYTTNHLKTKPFIASPLSFPLFPPLSPPPPHSPPTRLNPTKQHSGCTCCLTNYNKCCLTNYNKCCLTNYNKSTPLPFSHPSFFFLFLQIFFFFFFFFLI